MVFTVNQSITQHLWNKQVFNCKLLWVWSYNKTTFIFQHFLAFENMVWFRFIVFNATFNNISVISWRSVLLVEDTGEIHRPAAYHWRTLSCNVISSTLRHEQGLVMIGTDCICSYKYNFCKGKPIMTTLLK